MYSAFLPDRVQQIISKLPLFNNGQLQTLMREPVLHDKRLEHAKFGRYATELLERVTGTRCDCLEFNNCLEDVERLSLSHSLTHSLLTLLLFLVW